MLGLAGLLASALSEAALLACWPQGVDVEARNVLDLLDEGRITSATFASASFGSRDGRVWSRNSPSTPAAM